MNELLYQLKKGFTNQSLELFTYYFTRENQCNKEFTIRILRKCLPFSLQTEETVEAILTKNFYSTDDEHVFFIFPREYVKEVNNGIKKKLYSIFDATSTRNPWKNEPLEWKFGFQYTAIPVEIFCPISGVRVGAEETTINLHRIVEPDSTAEKAMLNPEESIDEKIKFLYGKIRIYLFYNFYSGRNMVQETATLRERDLERISIPWNLN